MQKQIGSVREMETLKKNQKKMLETKNIITEMKNALDGLIGRLDMAERNSQWTWIHLTRNFPNWKTRDSKRNK